ncbi:hypothetical protein [Pseudomarimonas salicorniae]|uniref:Uncharacterized protein n=1 Tax=Pseudomarimonas salicorniae TaxID=2933270 RepID=A0ABT0GG40_9GAMM|nr:hypothetical protein [Lysobacter sp. CAU 1642]MCK7593508.1 hypothetical protein [Lysobacter sp. CAU 1642]
MSLFASCALGLTILVVALNLNYSALSLLVQRLREGRWPMALPLGIPALGSISALAASLGLPAGHPAQGALVLLFLIDTGGPLAWLVSRILRRRREGARRLQPALQRHPSV